MDAAVFQDNTLDASRCPVLAIKPLEEEAFDAMDEAGLAGDVGAERWHRARYEFVRGVETYMVPASIEGTRHMLIAADILLDLVMNTYAEDIKIAGFAPEMEKVARIVGNVLRFVDSRLPEHKRTPI